MEPRKLTADEWEDEVDIIMEEKSNHRFMVRDAFTHDECRVHAANGEDPEAFALQALRDLRGK